MTPPEVRERERPSPGPSMSFDDRRQPLRNEQQVGNRTVSSVSKDDGCAFTRVRVAGMETDGLVDSGSAVTIIHRDALERSGLSSVPYEGASLKSAGESRFRPTGSLTACVDVFSSNGERRTVEIEILVVDNFAYQFLLGIDLI